jgi:hypothetical protein
MMTALFVFLLFLASLSVIPVAAFVIAFAITCVISLTAHIFSNALPRADEQ